MTRRSFRLPTALLLPIAVLIVVMGIAIWGAVVARSNLQQAFDRETQIQQAQTTLEEMLRVQIDEENSVRGYIETQDVFYKQQYASALDQFEGLQSGLRTALLAQNLTDIAAQLDEYDRQQSSWRTSVAEPLLAKPKDRPADIDRTNKFFTDAQADIAGNIRTTLEDRSNQLGSVALAGVTYALLFSLGFFVMFFLIAVWMAKVGNDATRVSERNRTTVETLQAVLQSHSVPLPGCDVGSAYAAASSDLAVGGDMYDMYRLSESRALITIADVSGKGVDAAVLVAFIRFTIRSIALRRPEPSKILAEFNTAFAHTYTVENPSLFVSMFVGVLDTDRKIMSYASAGHDSAFIRRSEKDVYQLAVTGPILGVMEEPFDTRTVQLVSGEMIVLATDGLTEARDRNGELLHEQGAMELIARASDEPQQLADQLIAQVRVLGGNRMRDDLAILAIRIHPPEEDAHA